MSNRAFGFHNADLVGAPWYVASTKYVAGFTLRSRSVSSEEINHTSLSKYLALTMPHFIGPDTWQGMATRKCIILCNINTVNTPPSSPSTYRVSTETILSSAEIGLNAEMFTHKVSLFVPLDYFKG